MKAVGHLALVIPTRESTGKRRQRDRGEKKSHQREALGQLGGQAGLLLQASPSTLSKSGLCLITSTLQHHNYHYFHHHHCPPPPPSITTTTTMTETLRSLTHY